MLKGELDDYDDGGGMRVKQTGPSVELSSQIAVPLGMAIHELTTNAAKYGALSELGETASKSNMERDPNGRCQASAGDRLGRARRPAGHATDA